MLMIAELMLKISFPFPPIKELRFVNPPPINDVVPDVVRVTADVYAEKSN